MKKLNFEKLKENKQILGCVRERLGAENAEDESKDAKIKRMTPHEFVGAWSGWKFGDESWAGSFIRVIELAYDTELSG